MFRGQYHHQLDDKGRFRIPSRFRDELGENPVMIVGFEKCLLLYTKEDFDKRVTKRFENSDFLDTKMSVLKRVIFPLAQEITEDKQGRVTLNPTLMSMCGMSKNIVSIGVMDRVEIWDEDRLKEHLASLDMEKILSPFSE